MAKKFLILVLAVCYLGASPAYLPAQADVSPATKQSPVCDQALQLVLADHEVKAKEALIDAYKQGNRTKTLSAEIPYFLAVFEKRQEQFDAALGYLLKARDIYAKDKTLSDRQMMLLTKRIGDCYYGADKMKDGLRQYNVALLAAKALPDSALPTSEILEGMVACELALKQYAEAENHSKLLVELCHSRMKNGVASEILRYGWALLQQSDIYRLSNQQEKLEVIRKQQIRPLFISFVEQRMTAEVEGKLPDYQTMVQSARTDYVDGMKPITPAEIAWAGSDFRVRTLPIIAWKNQSEKPVAAILCIHGMGLDNRAFTTVAGELNRRGYLVYALDVRGFGSWTQTRGEENLDYTQALADIHNVSLIIKARNPGVPLYILGESMGGAIAIRAGAQLGDELNGVISSVPSAERFQDKKMSLQTAMHFIIDPHRAFDIGTTVAERATSQEKLRAKWKADPKAKLGMTPIELIKFALFMRTTKPQAARITKLPVLMLQGLQDQLVKPQGTFDLFDAIRSTDKTFLTIGKAEHLMFENDSPDPILMDSLDSWLRNHVVPNNDKPSN